MRKIQITAEGAVLIADKLRSVAAEVEKTGLELTINDEAVYFTATDNNVLPVSVEIIIVPNFK